MRLPVSTPLIGVISALLLCTAVQARPIPEPTAPKYPGIIKLDVDVTDTERKIFQVRETLPVAAGPLMLFFPQWLPGNHSPTGQIAGLAGLTFKANGKPVEWTRDTVNMYAFHLTVPAGATALEAEYQYLTANTPQLGRVLVTPDIINLQWNSVVLYPAGVNAAGVTVEASMTYPAAWQFAAALETSQATSGKVQFKPVDLVNLIDSPAYVGKYFKTYELDPGAKVPVRFHVVADNAESLEAAPEQIEAHRKMVQQTYKVFGPGPYTHYDFLIAASENFGGTGGLEHRQSTEIGVGPGYFSKYKMSPFMRGAARIRACVERQIPPSRRSDHAQLQRADAELAVVGLRRRHQLLGRCDRRARRPALARGSPRTAGRHHRRHARPRRPQLAQSAGHHQ